MDGWKSFLRVLVRVHSVRDRFWTPGWIVSSLLTSRRNCQASRHLHKGESPSMLHFALTSVLMQLHTRESSMDLLLFNSICLLSSSILSVVSGS